MPAGRSKYFSSKFTDSNGIKWDSRLEYNRYRFLLEQQRLGLISFLDRQVRYTLLPKQTLTIPRTGKRGQPLTPKVITLEHEVSYFADFVYSLPDGTRIVEDTKSQITRTTDYKLKRKMMLFFHHIRIHEVEKATDPIPITPRL